MDAMEKLKSGVRFSEVATQYSEDKARQGVSNTFVSLEPKEGCNCCWKLSCNTHSFPADGTPVQGVLTSMWNNRDALRQCVYCITCSILHH